MIKKTDFNPRPREALNKKKTVKNMKHVIILLMAAVLTAACASLTPEQKAAREAATREYVKQAVASQKYTINVNSMKPSRRGESYPVFSAWLKVDGNTVQCVLPYLGLDDVPRLKSRAEMRMNAKYDFKSPLRNYVSGKEADGSTVISFVTDDRDVEFKIFVVIEVNGSSKIHIEPEGRDAIDYEGHVAIEKK